MKTRRFTAMLLTLAMVLSLCCMGTMASAVSNTDIGNVQVQFGDPEAEPTPPESLMSLVQGTGGVYNAVYTGTDADEFYPNILSLYAFSAGTDGANVVELVSLDTPAIQFATYDADGQKLHNSITYATNQNLNEDGELESSSVFTVVLKDEGEIEVRANGQVRGTIHFDAPKDQSTPATDDTPTGLNGYLPIGQYSNGNMWGSPYSNGSALIENGTPKVKGGYSATGVSLGAAGGYVEYDMNVANSNTTPYGVDFIVYGNAFVGNPEAASVKVYGTPVNGEAGWYELAGSLYYADETLRNVDVTYKKVTASGGDFDSAGIWYKISRTVTSTNSNGDEISEEQILRNWTKFNSNTNVTWWPEESEGYLGENGVWNLDGVTDVVVSADQTQITYQNVTLVRDTDSTPDYAFGYADVTPNGSSYGTPVNPYTYNTTGGNAYDISWAVDDNGEPVRLNSISKIRVYTSAALNVSSADAPIFTVPSIFGETSAEVCGIYAVAEVSGSSQTTSMAIVRNNGTVIARQQSDVVSNTQSYQTVNVSANSTISVLSAADRVYVNGELVAATTTNPYTFTLNLGAGESKIIQIVTQTGEYAAYIRTIRFVGVS